MRDEFITKLKEILPPEYVMVEWHERLIAAIMDEYEFTCKSFVYAGPGHQSRHECTNQRPHPIEGEHYDDLYEWIGTATYEELDEPCARCGGTGQRPKTLILGEDVCLVCRGSGKKRKLHNAPHEGYGCDMCRIPSELRA